MFDIESSYHPFILPSFFCLSCYFLFISLNPVSPWNWSISDLVFSSVRYLLCLRHLYIFCVHLSILPFCLLRQKLFPGCFFICSWVSEKFENYILLIFDQVFIKIRLQLNYLHLYWTSFRFLYVLSFALFKFTKCVVIPSGLFQELLIFPFNFHLLHWWLSVLEREKNFCTKNLHWNGSINKRKNQRNEFQIPVY